MLKSVKGFQTYSLYIPGRVKDFDGNLHNLRIIPAAFNMMWFSNDPHYLEADRTPGLEQEANGKTANVELVQNAIPESLCNTNRGDTTEITTLKSTDEIEKLFVTYCSSSLFTAASHICTPFKVWPVIII